MSLSRGDRALCVRYILSRIARNSPVRASPFITRFPLTFGVFRSRRPPLQRANGLGTTNRTGIGIEQSFGLAIVSFTLAVKTLLVPLQVRNVPLEHNPNEGYVAGGFVHDGF